MKLSTLNLAAKLLRPPKARREHKNSSGIKQIVKALTPSGYNQKLPLTAVKEELIHRNTTGNF